MDPSTSTGQSTCIELPHLWRTKLRSIVSQSKVVNPLREIGIRHYPPRCVSHSGIYLDDVDDSQCKTPLNFPNGIWNDSGLERDFPACRAFPGVLVLSKDSAVLV